MNAIFVNSGNSKTSDPHRLILNLTDKINLKRIDKCVALSNRNNKFKISVVTGNGEFELSDGLHSVSDI